MHELAGSEFHYPRPCMNLSYVGASYKFVLSMRFIQVWNSSSQLVDAQNIPMNIHGPSEAMKWV